MLYNERDEAFAAVCFKSRDLENFTYHAQLQYVNSNNVIDRIPFTAHEWPPTDEDLQRAAVIIKLRGGHS